MAALQRTRAEYRGGKAMKTCDKHGTPILVGDVLKVFHLGEDA
jgi:hypothetical protein